LKAWHRACYRSNVLAALRSGAFVHAFQGRMVEKGGFCHIQLGLEHGLSSITLCYFKIYSYFKLQSTEVAFHWLQKFDHFNQAEIQGDEFSHKSLSNP
jgi:hypothetical protein